MKAVNIVNYASFRAWKRVIDQPGLPIRDDFNKAVLYILGEGGFEQGQFEQGKRDLRNELLNKGKERRPLN